MVPHIHTTDGITVVLFGTPYHAAVSDPHYKDVVEGLLQGEYYLLEIFERIAQKLKNISTLTKDLEYKAGIVYYRGEPMHNYAVDKLISLFERNMSWQPLANFLQNLMDNPSKRVVDDLYRFLEKGKMPITDDGCFLAYKRVRPDYKDIHSGKFDNSVGSNHEMPRNRVDEDPNRTCSTGFHVCSYDYLPSFASTSEDRIMVCKVNPADVVAIPADYNDTKMRTCKYVVIGDVTSEFKKDENVLSNQEIAQPSWGLWVRFEHDSPYEDSVYWTEAEARAVGANMMVEEGEDLVEVWIEQDGDFYVRLK